MTSDFSYHISKAHYDIPENYQHHKLKIVEWLKPEGAHMEEGEPLIILGYEAAYGNKETLTMKYLNFSNCDQLTFLPKTSNH